MKTHEEIRAELTSKAVDDDAFRARLLENPKEAFHEAFGITVPESITIEVHEDSPMVAHLVLPPSSQLSASDLAAVAGGSESVPSGYSW